MGAERVQAKHAFCAGLEYNAIRVRIPLYLKSARKEKLTVFIIIILSLLYTFQAGTWRGQRAKTEPQPCGQLVGQLCSRGCSVPAT